MINTSLVWHCPVHKRAYCLSSFFLVLKIKHTNTDTYSYLTIIQNFLFSILHRPVPWPWKAFFVSVLAAMTFMSLSPHSEGHVPHHHVTSEVTGQNSLWNSLKLCSSPCVSHNCLSIIFYKHFSHILTELIACELALIHPWWRSLST